jgi:hypothetical protein
MIINIFTASAFKALITIVDAFLVSRDLYAMGPDTSSPTITGKAPSNNDMLACIPKNKKTIAAITTETKTNFFSVSIIKEGNKLFFMEMFSLFINLLIPKIISITRPQFWRYF